MAVEDIYRMQVIGEGREGEWSMTFHMQTLTEPTLGLDTDRLAVSASVKWTPLFTACMSADHQISRFKVDKIHDERSPGSFHSEVPAVREGDNAGVALPANTTMVIKIGQILFPPKHNGQVWMSGLTHLSVLGSVLTVAFRDGVVQTMLDGILENLDEDSAGDGLWRLVVLSRKHLVLNPGDFVGAAADAITTSVDARVGMMRSRSFGGRRKAKVIEV